MSTFQHKEGFGSLFNRKKEKDTQPDLSGDVMINGEVKSIAAWTKTDKNGNKFYSIKISEKIAVKQNDLPPAQTPPSDDLPF